MLSGSVLIEETTKRKKINDINEIWDGKNLITKEFIHLDLSNIDLSIIPKEEWEDCIFYNTSFKNTKIKFIPNKLKKINKLDEERLKLKYIPYSDCIYLNYCDFSDNNLSFLEYNDFKKVGGEVVTYGCNFRNTSINFLKTLKNVELDFSYADYSFNAEYWKFEVGSVNWPDFIDINTIIKNPFLKVPSFRLLNAILHYVVDMSIIEDMPKHTSLFMNSKLKIDEKDFAYIKYIVDKCESFLKYDKEGYAIKLYNKLKPFMSLTDKYEFFLFKIKNINIKDIDFEDIPIEVLRYYEFFSNSFNNVRVNYSIEELLKLWDSHFLDTIRGYENSYSNFYLPNIYYNSWQYNINAKKRVSNSAITFFTKVYLELSRVCNAKCPFCRNNTFENSEYNLEKIIKTLDKIKGYLNAVVIGGGEPTLKLEDVKKLRDSIKNTKFDWHMFSNGTNPQFINDDYIMENFKLNISRHAVNDLENANIFSVSSNKIMTTKELEKLNIRNGNVTLNAVCFNGGLDTFDKVIDYINYANNIGCKKVLIQDLQRSISLGNNDIKYNNMYIDANIFDRVREYLKNGGYKEKYPIYATGGYVSYILKNKEGFSVTLQRYINQEELDIEWVRAIKRTFDLSIAPNGDLYENWNQQVGKVKRLVINKMYKIYICCDII